MLLNKNNHNVYSQHDTISAVDFSPKEPTITIIWYKSMVLTSGNVEGFVINSFNQRLMITPEIMEYFDRRNSEMLIKEDTKITLGQPADYPHEMIGALSDYFKKNKDIKSAYKFLAHIEGEQKSNLLFIIDFTGDKEALFPKIGTIAQDFLGKDEYIDIVPLDSDFGKNAVKNSKPFYKRKKWRFS